MQKAQYARVLEKSIQDSFYFASCRGMPRQKEGSSSRRQNKQEISQKYLAKRERALTGGKASKNLPKTTSSKTMKLPQVVKSNKKQDKCLCVLPFRKHEDSKSNMLRHAWRIMLFFQLARDRKDNMTEVMENVCCFSQLSEM
ncbi:MAG: hypothetical protein K6F31_03035 [Acetatifactor sp.]|nr:hypothetical protein [Acetatifactor sp.]